ncbi:MAG: YciC family protein [Buchnera aphidicola (Meitanaphis microgallis)]
MNITTNLLYHDTINFLKKKWLTTLIIVLIASSITVFLDNIFLSNSSILMIIYKSTINPNYSFFDLLQTLTLNQKKQLLFFTTEKLFSSLISNTFLIGILTIFIKSNSFSKHNFYLELKNINLLLFVNLFLLILVNTIIVQLGFMLLIAPGILFFSFFSLSPIILIINNKNIIQSMVSSVKITLQNLQIIFPAIIFWLFSKLIVLILFLHIKTIPIFIVFLLLNITINLISSVLIIYLFRFYMLSSLLQNSN